MPIGGYYTPTFPGTYRRKAQESEAIAHVASQAYKAYAPMTTRKRVRKQYAPNPLAKRRRPAWLKAPQLPKYVPRKYFNPFKRPTTAPKKIKARYSGPVTSLRRFKGQRRWRVSKAASLGAMIKTETGGEVTDSECAFIGHSLCAPEKILRVFVMSLVRMLFRKSGILFKSFTDFPNEWTGGPASSKLADLHYYYKDGEAGARVKRTIAFATGRYNDFVDAIVTDIKTAFATVNQPTFLRFELALETQEATSVPVLPTTVNVDKMFLHLSMSSELSVQNRTVSTTAMSVSDNLVNNVNNNPLEGYSYYCAGNTFRTAHQDSTSEEFGPDLTYGQITQGHDTLVSAQDKENLKRPPMPSYFRNTKRYGKHRLMPGGIKKSNLKAYKVLHVNKFIRLLEHWLHANTTEGTSIFLGTAKMFAWEKLMHTRGVAEPNMIVGYECNNFYSCYITTSPSGIVVEKDIA
jgi:hypothetical protein